MKKILMAVGVLALAAGAYAAEFDVLSTVKAGELKAAASKGDIAIIPVVFKNESSGKDEKSAWCAEHPMAPGCPGYCTVSPMYPGCPRYCAKPGNHMKPGCPAYCAAYPNSPACKKSGETMKILCPPNALTPGCPQYCKAHPMAPECANWDPADEKSAVPAQCASAPMTPGCPMYCRHHHGFPGCPQYCQANPMSPACRKEAPANRSNCGLNPNSIGCPGFCSNAGMQMYPGCPMYCSSYPSAPECQD